METRSEYTANVQLREKEEQEQPLSYEEYYMERMKQLKQQQREKHHDYYNTIS